MTASELSALLVLATVGSFTPGPNTTLSTALAANLGLRPTLRFVLAVPFGWGLLLSLCAGGLGTLVVALPQLRWGIQAIGIAYLLWLALKLARTSTLMRAWLSGPAGSGQRLRWFNRLMAGVLVLTAGWMARL